jgi:hypothetical protein
MSGAIEFRNLIVEHFYVCVPAVNKRVRYR